MMLSSFIVATGGPKGLASKVSNMIIENENKISGLLEKREKKLFEEQRIKPSEKLNFSFTQVNGSLLIMENAISNKGGLISIRIITKYNLIQFSDLILELIEKAENEQRNNPDN